MVQRNIPLADQLIQELLAQISSGEIVGERGRLPSEAELGQRHSVSRATVREALTKLELAGIVFRRHGVGTFVSGIVRNQPGLISGWLDEAPAFVDLIARSGHAADTKLVSMATSAAGPVAGQLGLDPEAEVVAIEKIFLADQVPVIFSRTAIPSAFVQPSNGLSLSDSRFAKSTYQLLEASGNRTVQHQASEVRAVLADNTLIELLGCEGAAPLLRVEEIGYDLDQTALFYAIHYFHGDRVSFRQIRTPSFTID
jgi:GntR family transcriptional regulator